VKDRKKPEFSPMFWMVDAYPTCVRDSSEMASASTAMSCVATRPTSNMNSALSVAMPSRMSASTCQLAQTMRMPPSSMTGTIQLLRRPIRLE